MAQLTFCLPVGSSAVRDRPFEITGVGLGGGIKKKLGPGIFFSVLLICGNFFLYCANIF